MAGKITTPELIIPNNEDELTGLVEGMMRFHAELATTVEVIASELRRDLAHPQGIPMSSLRLDLKAYAYRVTRPIGHVAGLETSASKNWGKVHRTFNQLYGGGAAGGGSRSGFQL